jgi:hypothetical protein
LVRIKATTGWGCFYTRSPIANGWVHHPCAIDDPRGRLFVRAKSVAAVQLTGFARSRAPTVFLVRIKNIRTKNTVMVKSKNGLGLFSYDPVDCARTAFRPRNIATLQQRGARFKSPGTKNHP